MKYKTYIFSILVIAQLCVPSIMIAEKENVLKTGVAYKFKTAPVDPYDVMRGRYVALGFNNNRVKVENDSKIERKQIIYVAITEDEDGFAQFGQVNLRRPENGDYLRTKVISAYSQEVRFSVPFDRYYMNEEKAPEAERLYRKMQRTEGKEAFVIVRVKNGKALIEDLVIDNKPVSSYFK